MLNYYKKANFNQYYLYIYYTNVYKISNKSGLPVIYI